MSQTSPHPSPSARAWLELARLSNAPTVLTNVLVGVAVAAHLADAPIPWQPASLAMGAALLLYTAGMVTNDAMDANRDAQSRPARPIPSGRIRTSQAWAVGWALLLGGVSLALIAGVVTGLIAGGIAVGVLLYTRLHAKHAWAVVLMGACRFALYPLGAAAVSAEHLNPAVLILGGVLGVSTLLLTLVARAETTDNTVAKRPLAWSVGIVLLAAPLLIEPPMMRSTWSLFSAVALAFWVSFCARSAIAGRLHVAIPGWIAGFCLFDAMLLAMYDRPDLAVFAASAFVLTHLAQRVLPGT